MLRERVGAWRREGYPGVTSRVTRDLLLHWFESPDRPAWQRLFYAQREAVETAIWLNEVADKSNPGTHALNQLREEQQTAGEGDDALPRIAFKMATGTTQAVDSAPALLVRVRTASGQFERYQDDVGALLRSITPGVAQ